jgi:hypothetical protein
VYLVLLVAALAILGGVVVVAMGRGGEMAIFRRDVPLPLLRFRSPADVATVQLPVSAFGYQVQATGDALAAAASLVAARDAEIVLLRRELLRLGGSSLGGSSLGGSSGGEAGLPAVELAPPDDEPDTDELAVADPADQDAGGNQ